MMRRHFLPLAYLVCALHLGACSKVSQAPQDTFFRLPEPHVASDTQAVSDGPIVVHEFRAEGLHRERMMVYTEAQAPETLHTHPYDLWLLPPARLLQSQLITHLRAAHAAPLVVDQEASQTDGRTLHLRPSLHRMEQRLDGARAHAELAIEFRVERNGAEVPLLVREYHATIPVEDTTVAGIVPAFGKGFDQICADLIRDLALLPRDTAQAPALAAPATARHPPK